MFGEGSTTRRIVSILVCGLMALCVTPAVGLASPDEAAAATAPPDSWSGWVSSEEPFQRLEQIQRPSGSEATDRNVFVDPDPAATSQVWRGVGASLTDSSVDRLKDNPAALSLLFDPRSPKGAHLNLVRMPISATDFPGGSWTLTPSGASTWKAPVQVQAAVTTISQIKTLQPRLEVVATPWSAPAKMKTSNVVNGGALRAGQEHAYAILLFEQAQWLLAQGVPLRAMTIVNEPFASKSNYPTMTMTPAQMATVAKSISTPLSRLGVELWAVDHNWEHAAKVGEVLDKVPPGTFKAAAYHCYGGEPGQMTGTKVPPIVTECTGEKAIWAETVAWDAHNLVVDSIRAGSTGLFMWNLALESNSPRTTGGCPNCRGVLTIKNRLQPPRPEPEFSTLAHLSRAADPGSKVLVTGTPEGMPVVAFKNPNGEIGVFGYNATNVPRIVNIRIQGGAQHRFKVPTGALFTLRGKAGSPDNTRTGKILRSPDGYRYYVDKTGYRHFIADNDIFACHGGWDNTIDAVPWSEISKIPETERAACFTAQAGDIIRHPDGDSYVYDSVGGKLLRRWIPTAGGYLCAARVEGRRVVAVTRYWIEEIPSGADGPSNCIVRGPGGDAHYINDKGRREWIPDSPTWDCETGKGVRVTNVAADFVNGIGEAGWHYCLNQDNLQGKVLRHADGDAHYIHPDNTRTWIPDGPTWDCRMRQGKAVVDTRWREYVTAFRDTGWDYCFDPVVFRGKVLRHADGDAYFVHPDDTKTWIPDGATWACRRNQGVPVVETRWREYVNRFRGSEWDYCYDINTMKNRIISHPDGDSHYVDSEGVRHWIPSGAVYNCLRDRGIPADTVRWREYINRTPEGDWAVCGDTLRVDQRLDRGQWLQSTDGRYRLIMQWDGNLVAYNSTGRAIWATNRFGTFAIVQRDGNFVEYAAGPAVWASNTVGRGGDRLVMQSDGNLVLYAGDRAVWASNTVGW